MGDEHAGEFQLFVQLTQPAAQLFAHLRIQRAERFVQQQNLRFHRRGARQRHALFLAAGQLRRIAVGQMAQLYHFQQLGDFLFDRRGVRPLAARQHGQAEGDVVEHRHVAEQRIVLKHEAHAPVARVHVADVGAVEAQLAAALAFQPGNDAQQRGLAGTGRPEQRHHLAGSNIERDIVQYLGATEGLVDAVNLNAHDFPPARDARFDVPDATAARSSKIG